MKKDKKSVKNRAEVAGAVRSAIHFPSSGIMFSECADGAILSRAVLEEERRNTSGERPNKHANSSRVGNAPTQQLIGNLAFDWNAALGMLMEESNVVHKPQGLLLAHLRANSRSALRCSATEKSWT
jgi:hypothetical protein